MAIEQLAVMPLSDYQAACNAVREKGGSASEEIKSGELAEAITNIPSGGEEDPFYTSWMCRVIDYDGTVLKEEWHKTGESFVLPQAPAHDGLIFQEWASPLDIVNNAVVVEDQDIIIGATFTTVSGHTEIDIELTELTGLTITLSFNNYSNIRVEWGDGSFTQAVNHKHEYSEYGKYTISFWNIKDVSTSAMFSGITDGNSSKTAVIRARIASKIMTSASNQQFLNERRLETVTIAKTNDVDQLNGGIFNGCSSLKACVLPNGQTLQKSSGYMFTGTYSLKNVVIPKTVVNMYAMFSNGSGIDYVFIPNAVREINSTFHKCVNLRRFRIPSGITTSQLSSIGSNCPQLEQVFFPEGLSFQNPSLSSSFEMTKIKKFTLPNYNTSVSGFYYSQIEEADLSSATGLSYNSFQYCGWLKKIIFGENIQTISQALSYCISLRVADFRKAKTVPTLSNYSTFNNNNTPEVKIVVPDELYEEWRTATNWVNNEVKNKIIKASEYVEE